MKLPEHKLITLLKNVGISPLAEDCSIVEINSKQVIITNIDIFTPIHDDPYIMGKIAACNVTNDLFAMNATEIQSYSCFLGLPFDIPSGFGEKMIQGTRDFLRDLGADIHGGHTIQNPWPLLGGTASSVMEKADIIYKRGVKEGDHIIITKPLGIQAIMAAYRVKQSNPSLLEKMDKTRINLGIKLAEKSMMLSNIKIPQVIKNGRYKQGIHAMTDITGFGFKGHLTEMLQESGLGTTIDTLPVFPTVPILDEEFNYGILEGCGAEIAGAMLMSVDPKMVRDFTIALTDAKIWWHDVGQICSGISGLKFKPNFRFIEVDDF